MMNYAMATKRNTYFLGTLRKCQRANLPKPIMPPTKGKKTPIHLQNMERGDTRWMYSNKGALKCNRDVYVGTNFPTHTGDTSVVT